jgi:hypothetical protein
MITPIRPADVKNNCWGCIGASSETSWDDSVPNMRKHGKVTISGTRTRQELINQVSQEVISVSLQELPRARVLETECIKVIFTLSTGD